MSKIVLSGNVELKTPLIVQNGEELEVLPGTVITCFTTAFPTTAETIANTGIIIGAAGSKITMNGTKASPITVKGAVNQKWGGLQVCSYDAVTPKSVLESFTVAEVGETIYNALRYGAWTELVGRNTTISINYVQLVDAGSVIKGDREFNAFTLCAVTTRSIHNIKVLNSVDDGIEIFSGDVSGTNWVVENAQDDALDVDQGANVSVINLLLLQSGNNTHLEMGSLKNDLGNSLLIASNVLTNGNIRTILKDNTQALLSGFIPNGAGRPSLVFDYNSWGTKVNDFGVTNQMICVPPQKYP
jgi:hypothetical protein